MPEIDGLEWYAQVARFRSVVQDWELDDAEVDALLGLSEGQYDLTTGRLPSGEAELRLRLLIELDIALRAVFGPQGLRIWLHDEPLDDGVTPFEFIARGVDHIKAMRAAALARA